MVVLRSYRDRPLIRGSVLLLAIGIGVTLLTLFLRPHARIAWMHRVPLAVATPAATGLTWLRRGIARAVTGEESRALRDLRADLAAAQAALAAAEEAIQERDRLRALLGFLPPRPDGKASGIAARVIAHDPRAAFKTVLLDRGAADGVAKGMVAVARGGLIGRVEHVAPHSATLLLLIDPNHAVDVWVQRSRMRGLLVGNGRQAMWQRVGGVTRLEYLADQADVAPGDVVVTTGLDGRAPRGIPVGTVQSVYRGGPGLATEAEVLPFAEWGAVEEAVLLP